MLLDLNGLRANYLSLVQEPISVPVREPVLERTCRSEVLQAIEKVLERQGSPDVTLKAVWLEMQATGTEYTYDMVSRTLRAMSGFEWKGHTTHDDLVQVRRGTYRLRR